MPGDGRRVVDATNLHGSVDERARSRGRFADAEGSFDGREFRIRAVDLDEGVARRDRFTFVDGDAEAVQRVDVG